MPIYVSVYHLDKTIVAKTDGEVTLADLDGYFAAIVKARAMSYRKIFDSSGGSSVLTLEQIDTFRKRITAFVERGRGKVGPFAVVTGGTRNKQLSNICRVVATADRPVKLFDDIHGAREWLDEMSPVN